MRLDSLTNTHEQFWLTYSSQPVWRDNQFALVASNAELFVGVILTTLNSQHMHKHILHDQHSMAHDIHANLCNAHMWPQLLMDYMVAYCILLPTRFKGMHELLIYVGNMIHSELAVSLFSHPTSLVSDTVLRKKFWFSHYFWDTAVSRLRATVSNPHVIWCRIYFQDL